MSFCPLFIFVFLCFQNYFSLEHDVVFFFSCGVGYFIKEVGNRICFSQGN